MRAFFRAPRFDSDELTRGAARVHAVALSMAALMVVFHGSNLLLGNPRRLRLVLLMSAAVGVAAVAIALNRAGRVRSGAWAVVVGLSLIFTALAVTAGGVHAPASATFVVVVLVAGLLLGERVGIGVALVWMAMGLVQVVLEATGVAVLSPPERSVTSLWLIQAIAMGIALKVLSMSTATVREALGRAESEVVVRRRAEERLAQALEAGGIGVWEHDVATNRTHADERLFEIFGRPPMPDGVA